MLVTNTAYIYILRYYADNLKQLENRSGVCYYLVLKYVWAFFVKGQINTEYMGAINYQNMFIKILLIYSASNIHNFTS